MSNPDYKGVNVNEALDDFKKRISLYEMQYEPIDDELDKDLSFIKIFEQGASFIINRTQGWRNMINSFVWDLTHGFKYL